MVLLYVVCIVLFAWLVVSYIVFCAIFMPKKTLNFEKDSNEVNDSPVITDNIKEKYFAIYNEIVISGTNGNNLYGRVYSQKNNSTWIVFLHGYRGRCTNMLKYMEHFRKAGGFNLLTIDLCGHGKRKEKYFLLGSTGETDDIMQWVNWIRSENKEARVILFGVSLGGATAINTAGRNPSSVDGVITDSAPSSFEAMIKRIMRHKCGFLSNLIMPLVSLYARIFAKLKIEETSSIAEAPNVNCPILLIHSTGDHFVPLKMMHEIFESLTVKNKEYLEITGAEHTHSVDVNSESYWIAVDKFVQQVSLNNM